MSAPNIKTAAGTLELSPAVARFFDRKKSSPFEIGVALSHVVQAMTSGGGFEKHLEEGQGEWAPLSPSYAAEKQGGEIFVYGGAVLKAITQDASGGVTSQIGEAEGGVPNKVRYSKNGIYVSVVGLAKGKPSLVIGFEGKYKKNPLAKRGIVGAKKKVAGGGFAGKGKAGTLGLPYANVVQAGRFKGLTAADGTQISAKAIAFHKGNAKRGNKKSRRILAKFKGATENRGGSPRPLLPAKSQDAELIGKALEAGVKAALGREGLVVT